MKKLLMAISQPLLLKGTDALLKMDLPNIELASSTNYKETVDMLATKEFSSVIIDLGPMTVNHVLSLLKLHPSLQVLMITDSIPLPQAHELYKKGLFGIILLSAPLHDISVALKQVMAGNIYLCEAFKRHLINVNKSNATTVFPKLSKRETELANLMLKGKGLSEIGVGLKLKPSTISTMKYRIFEKLGIKNLKELERIWVQPML